MGRPRVPLGEHTNFITKAESRTKWVAKTRFGAWTGDSKRLQACGRTKSEAEANLREKIADERLDRRPRRTDLNGLETATDPENPEAANGPEPLKRSSTLADAVAAWQFDLTYRDSARSTDETYRRIAKQIEKTAGRRLLKDVNVAFCEMYLRRIADEHPSKAKHHRTVLRQVMRIVVGHGVMTTNPVDSIGHVTRPRSRTVRALTSDEVDEARRAIRLWHQGRVGRHTSGPRPDPYLVDLLDLCLGTGARIGEILALRWGQDIDLETGVIRIAGTVDRSGRRQDHTKTRAVRELVAPRFVMDTLLARKVNQPQQSFTDAVFPTRNGRFRSTSSAHRAYRQARLEQAGLPPDGAFHLYRHAIATLLAETHGDLPGASRQLGHASEHITDTTYVHRGLRAPDNSSHIEAYVIGLRAQAAADSISLLSEKS